jgi:hypothetical protein
MRDAPPSHQSSFNMPMKTIKTISVIISLIIASVALFVLWDFSYWHALGLRFEQSPYLPGSMFWVGVLLTDLATAVAVWRVRGHWKDGGLLGLFLWCCLLCVSYTKLFVYVTHNPTQ